MEKTVSTCQGQDLLRSLCRVLKAACAPCLVSEKPHPSVWKDEPPGLRERSSHRCWST